MCASYIQFRMFKTALKTIIKKPSAYINLNIFFIYASYYRATFKSDIPPSPTLKGKSKPQSNQPSINA